jgi:hypothetical protein
MTPYYSLIRVKEFFMNTKLTIVASAVMIGISSMANAANPPLINDIYSNGPQSPIVATTDLSAAERAAYALYEGVMQVAEARIHAQGCTSLAADVSIFANGYTANNASKDNSVEVVSGGSTFELDAQLDASVAGRGQKVVVDQIGAGKLGGIGVSLYHADVVYNSVNNMMVSDSRVDVVGINGRPDSYSGRVIKDFYRGALNSSQNDYYTIFDWGLQSISKLGYPVNKYWQRSKSRRDNGDIGRTVFVKDRLVGANSCRITIDTVGSNNRDFFWQNGSLKIESVAPSAPVVAFDEHPFN